MIVVAGFAIVLLTVPLLGGRLVRMAQLEFAHGWLALFALWVQIPITTFAAGWFPETVTKLIHVATYGFAIAFVWFNRRIPGIPLLFAGTISNLLPIVLNGGVMPASLDALNRAGFDLTPEDFVNSGLVENPRLWFLGDIFAVPAGWPLANVFSVGDIMLVVGGGILAHTISLSRLTGQRRTDTIVREYLERLDAQTEEFAARDAAREAATAVARELEAMESKNSSDLEPV